MKTYVIDVQRCSIHDGPGIRTTVFLKGCPLKCAWCHNPESQCFQKELSFNQSLCTMCGACVNACQHNVHTIENGVHVINYANCIHCGACVSQCPTKAMSIIGNEMTPQEVFDIVVKDEIFYAQGKGGVTISGGEALSHTDFCITLLKLCKEKGIHTCIETSGFAAKSSLEQIAPYVDLFLFDCKVTNEEDAQKYIGGSLKIIQESFDYLYAQNKDIILRCPIIPTVNDNSAHFNAIIEIAVEYPKLAGIELLPYHDFGVSKGNNIGKETRRFETPNQQQINEWIQYFQSKKCDKVKLS